MAEKRKRNSRRSNSPKSSSSSSLSSSSLSPTSDSNRRRQQQQQKLYPNLEPRIDFRNESIDRWSDDNVSYESDHMENDDDDDGPQRNSRSSSKSSRLKSGAFRFGIRYFRIVCGFFAEYKLAFIIILLCLLCLSYLYNGNPVKDIDLLKTYKQQIVRILKKDFTYEYLYGNNTKAVLRLVGEKWIAQEPVEPYVVLITGKKADALADALRKVFSNVTKRGEIDWISCHEWKKRQSLENEVTKSLSKSSKSVILQGIHRLRGDAPLYLHSLSDSDHSPFRSALILMTIGLPFGLHPSCEDEISSYLLAAWNSSYMNEDQIRPILSRISSFVICLGD